MCVERGIRGLPKFESSLKIKFGCNAESTGTPPKEEPHPPKAHLILRWQMVQYRHNRTKHINIRYCFVTDRIRKGELTVEWCPTGDMIGDFRTKPNQGALFKKFRDQIMGVGPMATILGNHRSVLDIDPVTSEKPSTISDKLTSARTEGAWNKRKAHTNQSWADVVKSRPRNNANAALQPLNKR